MHYAIRPALKSDESFLWQMLYYAAHMDEDSAPRESARSNPDLAYYVEDWMMRHGDLGFLAITFDGSPIGAAWIRMMPSTSPLYRYVALGTPELAIATLPGHIGKGDGSMVLRRLIEAARATAPAIALSVRANNPARHLYERFGFAIIAEITNRVGARSYVMAARLA